jgi:hypothetical protein
MKKALIINAAFSCASGVALIVFKNQFRAIFELNSSDPFWIVGLALIFFTSTILYEVRKLNKLRIIWIITQDMLWVFASIYILEAKPFSVSKAGTYIITIVALIVFVMAVNQWTALRRLNKTS